jgi:Phosphodiester glycosidase
VRANSASTESSWPTLTSLSPPLCTTRPVNDGQLGGTNVADADHGTFANQDGNMTEASRSDRSRRRRVVRILIGSGITVLLIAAGIAYWALDRFVIDHVEISNVSVFEEQARQRQTATSALVISGPAAPPSQSTQGTAPNADSTGPTSTTVASLPESPVFTDTSYRNGSTSVEITKIVAGEGPDTLTYFVANVVVANASEIRSGFAENKFGRNIIQDTSEIAADNNAVFAVNGDYYGFRSTGIVIRNGIAFRDEPARTGLATYADGTMVVYDETAMNAEELIAEGVVNTLSFGPALVDDGQVVAGIDEVEVDTNFGNHSIQGRHPRTGIGMVAPNHFVFIVVDGRSPGYSRGVTLTEFAQMFQQFGATVAYNLDGGGSATMYFNGEVVNNPLGKGKERGTSDILYLG